VVLLVVVDVPVEPAAPGDVEVELADAPPAVPGAVLVPTAVCDSVVVVVLFPGTTTVDGAVAPPAGGVLTTVV
jgi:hypothetical protein